MEEHRANVKRGGEVGGTTQLLTRGPRIHGIWHRRSVVHESPHRNHHSGRGQRHDGKGAVEYRLR